MLQLMPPTQLIQSRVIQHKLREHLVAVGVVGGGGAYFLGGVELVVDEAIMLFFVGF